MKLGVSRLQTTPFAQLPSEEIHHLLDDGRLGVRPGYDFDQLHVARRIKEMHPEEAAAKLRRPGREPTRR